MIRRLRMKLIVASMVSLLIVLTSIVLVISIFNYHEVVENADDTLEILLNNNGVFPVSEAISLEEDPAEKPSIPEEGEWQENEKEAEDLEPPQGESLRQWELLLSSPELPYESRYFSVYLNAEGEVVSADLGMIAAVDEECAENYAKSIWDKGETSGFVDDYRFMMTQSEEITLMVFLDCGRNLDTFRTFVLTSIGVSAAGLLAVFLLMIVLSARMVKPFSENYEKQRRFITDAGHEIKTPLTIIDADAEILSMDLGENEWLEDIRQQTERLTSLTNDLILLSRMEEKDNRLQMIELPLSELVEEVLHSFQALALTQGKTLTGNITPLLSLEGDDRTLRQLVGILLDNAVKYGKNGTDIILNLERLRNQVKLTVSNETDSLPREQLERFFDRFYRGDFSRSSRTRGYGLGLSIAAAIVKAHRGKINAGLEGENRLVITVLLPIAQK